MDQSNFSTHCGAVIIADSDRPHLEIGPRFKTLEPRWATMEGAAVYSGLSRGLLWLAARVGHIRTANVRRGANNKRGRSLVERYSIDAVTSTPRVTVRALIHWGGNGLRR